MRNKLDEIKQNIEAAWEKGGSNQLCRDAEWLVAEVERVSALPTWTPIDEAPKDRRRLGGLTADGEIYDIWWDGSQWVDKWYPAMEVTPVMYIALPQRIPSNTSDWGTAIEPEQAIALQRRREILMKSHLTENDERELEVLEKKIGTLPAGQSPEDIRAMDIIRRAAKLLEVDDERSP